MWILVLSFSYLLNFLNLSTVNAAVAILPAQPKPEKFANDQGCYIPANMLNPDRVLAYNESFSPRDGISCNQYNCQENGETQIFTCGAMAVPDSCEKVSGNKFLPYPDCCDGISCPQTTTAQPDPLETTTAEAKSCDSKSEPVENPSAEESSPTSDAYDEDNEIPTDSEISTTNNAPVDTVADDNNSPVKSGPIRTLPVQPPATSILSESTNNTPSSSPGLENGPLKHGPVFSLPVQPPGQPSKVVDSESSVDKQNNLPASGKKSIYRGPIYSLPVQPPAKC